MNDIDLSFITVGFIGNKLRKTRKSKGITLKKVTDDIGLSTATLHRIEDGSYTYNIDSLIRYASYLGYDFTIYKRGNTLSEERESDNEVTDE